MTDIIFVGQFIASKAGKTGLTVTVDVDRYTISDGSRTALVTAGSATEGRRGLYSYRLASADLATYQYVATFITSDATVDQQEIAALGLVVPDALTSSRLAPATAGRALEVAATGEASANVTYLNGSATPVDNLVLAIENGGTIRANLISILGTALTETAGQIAAAFRKFFNVSSPTGTVNSLATAAALAVVDANVDAILEDTGTTLPAALAVVDASVDAIKVITDNIDVSAVTHVAASNAGYLTITIGRTFSESVTGLAIPADWKRAYFTVKKSVEDDESLSIIQLLASNPEDLDIDGVRYLNGVLWHEAIVDDPDTETDETSPEPFDQDIGILTVNQPAGSITIYLTDELTVQLSTAKRIGWDVKFIDASGDSSGWRGIMDMVKTETQTV